MKSQRDHSSNLFFFLLKLEYCCFPSIRVFSSGSARCIRWPKYQSFSFSIMSSNEYLGLICFRSEWFAPAAQGTLKNLLQHHNWKASILQRSAFFIVQLSHPYMTTGKNESFDQMAHHRQSDVSVQVCHCFPSREQASFSFMAAVTVHGDFGGKESTYQCRRRRQQRMTVRQYHLLRGHESEQTGNSGGQRSLVCYSPWVRKELDTMQGQTTAQLLYDVVIVFSMQQSESAICLHLSSFWISFPSRWPKSIEQSSPCGTVVSHSLSILNTVSIERICQSQSPNSSHHCPFPSWYPCTCSLHLCLYFCFANKIIYENKEKQMVPN